jgi:DNA-binding NtrC family response regulator
VTLVSILVIDDDVEMRNMLRSALENEGYLVKEVENGREAVKTCEKSLFDVALIDVKLPDMKGTELLNKLKKIQPKMIRIIITGYPTLETAMESVNERADGYVLKPFKVEVLLETIRKLLNEKMSEYLSMLTEAKSAIDSTPTAKYQNPDKW